MALILGKPRPDIYTLESDLIRGSGDIEIEVVRPDLRWL
jgi:hypothetical protein